MVELKGAIGAYDREILNIISRGRLDIELRKEERGTVEDQRTVEAIGTSVMYPTAQFSWQCSTPEAITPVLKLFMRVAKERQAGVLSFGVCVDGGMPDDGLVKRVKEAFAAAVNKPKNGIKLGYLPIEGRKGPLACIVYFANIINYV